VRLGGSVQEEHSITRRSREEVYQASRPLVWREKRDDYLPPVAATFAAQSIADLAHRVIIAEP
jgi:hypothetical protein